MSGGEGASIGRDMYMIMADFLMKKKLCMYGERERKRVPAAGEHAMRCLCLAGESHKCDSALI